MITLIALALTPFAQAEPVPAREYHYRSFNVHAARAAGCHVSQVHLPVGKPGHAPAVIRCPAPVRVLEAGWRHRETARAL
jgi:hypothetical protein